jgi:hypothetical protein
MWKEALEDANSCVSINEKFDKGTRAATFFFCVYWISSLLDPHYASPPPPVLPGYARKAGALMGMHKHEEALKVCKVRRARNVYTQPLECSLPCSEGFAVFAGLKRISAATT